MRVLVTGASGHIASAVIPELVTAGHHVIGLARSERSAVAVQALGAEVRHGHLDDLDGLHQAAQSVDGVVHLAFKHEEMRSGAMDRAVESDLQAIETIGAALAGSGKPFVGTSATLALVMAGLKGEETERDTLPGGPRIGAENAVVALADKGVRTSIVRLPPTVHSELDRSGFIRVLISTARDKGVAGYLGDGANRWPAANTHDVGTLYRLALENAAAGSRFCAAAEGGVTLGDIAAAISRRLDVPVRAVPDDEAGQHFGFLAGMVALDNPTSSALTREVLGWAPTHRGLIADIESDIYTPSA